MVTAKVIRVPGPSPADIEETTSLIQDALEKVHPSDLRQLLQAVKRKPSIVKTALKFL